jgi:uncharacterized protein YcbX
VTPSRPAAAGIAALHRYPLKSGRGQSLQEVRLCATGFEHDRQWMLVTPEGRFISQRERPRLALLQAEPGALGFSISAPELPPLMIPHAAARLPCRVRIWRDECAAFDAGDETAAALSRWLGHPCRLVRFDPAQQRLSERRYSGEIDAANAFSDAFPLLLIGEASRQDLSRRVGRELPMNRFRPNIVLEGLGAYDEDQLLELRCGKVLLRVVKPCTRCSITTTKQSTGTLDGAEPLRTLKGYRYDAALGGVCFGQNLVMASGVGSTLAVGASLQLRWRS